MPNSVPAAFRSFKSHLELADSLRQEVARSQRSVRRYLERHIDIKKDFLIGSYERNTMIPQARDVDLLIVLDPKYWHGYAGFRGLKHLDRAAPLGLLYWLKGLLDAQFGKQARDIRPDGQAVTVSFEHIDLDVVPAFVAKGPGGYLICNASAGSDLLATKPEDQDRCVTDLNSRRNDRFVPLVKMVKYWNHANGYSYPGFWIEMLAYRIFSSEGKEIADFQSGLLSFFVAALDWTKGPLEVPDPGSSRDLTPAYLREADQLETLRTRLTAARELCEECRRADEAGKVAEAIACWRNLFPGGAFPEYSWWPW